jgi:hypothetical protein
MKHLTLSLALGLSWHSYSLHEIACQLPLSCVKRTVLIRPFGFTCTSSPTIYLSKACKCGCTNAVMIQFSRKPGCYLENQQSQQKGGGIAGK